MDFEQIGIELDRKLDTFLNENDIKTRRVPEHGLWMNFLLPVAVILGAVKTCGGEGCSSLYKTSACVSCGLLADSLLVLLQINSSTFLRTVSYFVSSAVTAISLMVFTEHGLLFNLLLGVVSSLGFHMSLLALLKSTPFSFTFGEASVIVQSAVLFISSTAANLGGAGQHASPSSSSICMQYATLVLQVGLSGVLGVCLLSKLSPKLRQPAEFYMTAAFIMVGLVVPILHVKMGCSPLLWIFGLLFEDMFTLQMLTSWVVLSGGAVAVVALQVSGGKKASTVVRKTFHVLALAVFVPGLLFRPCVLYLASGVVLALFIGLEALRIMRLPPIGDGLERGFIAFADEKDEGPLALTPVYLLVGCAGPLWLHPLSPIPPTPNHLLPLLAGLLAVGVGDTAASACGTWFGQHNWPGSKKTKEGSAACFISQLFTILALIHYGYVPRTDLLRPITACALSSIVEAKTEQVDNLALPLLMYIVLL